MINKDDTVTFEYTPHISVLWPTTIKDQYGNFMFDTSGAPVSVTNSMDYSGNLKIEGGVSLGSSYDTIDLDYNVDICLNSVDKSTSIAGIDGFTFTVDEPEISINEVELKGVPPNNIATLKLSAPLYATSNASFTYSNSGSKMRSNYGFKLKNETTQSVSVASIPAPGNTNKYAYNSGKLNEFGIIDLSFNPPIDDIGNGEGWQFKTSYIKLEFLIIQMLNI